MTVKNNITSSFAPIVCVEVLSPCNTLAEMRHKQSLYFDKGAEEFWICDSMGNMRFYNTNGELNTSNRVENFPANIDF